MLPVAILAGGLGTRLGAVAAATPKILVDIDGRPFAEYQLDWLRKHGVRYVVYCLGHMGDQVVAALGDGSRWGMRFEFVMDGPVLLGTGGALRRAMPGRAEAFFVLYGDSLLTCDLADVARVYAERRRACLMTVVANANQWDRSNVLFRDGEILAYDKTDGTSGMAHIDYGLGVVSSAVLLSYPAEARFDLAQVYQDQLRQGELAAYEVATRFYEIGSPAGLEDTRAFVRSMKERRE